jgi:hypothetical protein
VYVCFYLDVFYLDVCNIPVNLTTMNQDVFDAIELAYTKHHARETMPNLTVFMLIKSTYR